MDPFTWFLIVLGVVIVGAIVWQMTRRSRGGVDDRVVSSNKGQALGKAEYHGRQPHGSSDGGPLGGGF